MKIKKGCIITVSDLRNGDTLLMGIADKIGETKGDLSYVQLNTGYQLTISEEE